MNSDQALARLRHLAGIHHDYWDVRGQRHETTPETARAILAAQGLPVSTDADIAHTLTGLEDAPWRDVLPPVMVVRQGEVAGFALNLPAVMAQRALDWRLDREDGTSAPLNLDAAAAPVVARHDVAGTRIECRHMQLPPLPCGYHTLTLAGGPGEWHCKLIVAPARCYLPPVLARGKAFGISAQLYALRTGQSPGIGEYGDLGALLEWAREQGAHSVGVNPLHAPFAAQPDHASPYSPSSRQFLNPLYLDVPAIADFAECEEAKAAWCSSAAAIATARAADLIDYRAVAALKQPIFEMLHTSFRKRHLAHSGDGRAAAFDDYVARMGTPLTRFALHGALCEHFGTSDWSVWPQAYRNPHSTACQQFAAEHAPRLNFQMYVQWQCDQQLGEAAARGRRAGLGIGIYGDLAVSSSPDGADVWGAQGVFSAGARVGAPPDALAEGGQEWGVVPMNPVAMRRTCYAEFIALLRANMRHFGALRIDHAMELERLFWIPRGLPNAAGAYVAYPVDDLMAILALESQRNKCLIVGEDLGTVPEGFRDRLAAANVFSYRVLYFEDEAGRFKQPDEYPELAAACVSTHDLPTLKGYWEESDLADRMAAGQFAGEAEMAAARKDRRRAKAGLLAALEKAGLMPDIPCTPDETVLFPELAAALHRFLARSDAKLLMVQLDDLAGESAQANMPGTTDQFPNWRRREAVPLEEMAASPSARAILDAVRAERGA